MDFLLIPAYCWHFSITPMIPYYCCPVNHHNRHYPKGLHVVSPQIDKNLKNILHVPRLLQSLLMSCLLKDFVSLRGFQSFIQPIHPPLRGFGTWRTINHPFGENPRPKHLSRKSRDWGFLMFIVLKFLPQAWYEDLFYLEAEVRKLTRKINTHSRKSRGTKSDVDNIGVCVRL